MAVSDSERALVERAGAWEHILCFTTDGIPHVTVRLLLTGGSFHSTELTEIQLYETFVDTAGHQLRKLRDTLDGFGQPKLKEY